MRKESKKFMNPKEMHKYDDILDLPHHVSKSRPQMPAADRAAQFAPFAALSGHHEAVNDTARQTDERIELDESSRAMLDWKLQEIQRRPAGTSLVSVAYFVPDSRKAGGAYATVTEYVKKIDGYKRNVILADGTSIPVDDIMEIVVLTSEEW